MQNKQTEIHPQRTRDQHLIQEQEHDPYRARGKLADGTSCKMCGAVFIKGRWVWNDGKVDASQRLKLCPACQRIQDRVPAGELNLGGEFLAANREQIINLINNVEQREKAEHPLKRILRMYDRDRQLTVEFTEAHLVRAVAEAIQKAHSGHLEYCYNADDMYLKAVWRR